MFLSIHLKPGTAGATCHGDPQLSTLDDLGGYHLGNLLAALVSSKKNML